MRKLLGAVALATVLALAACGGDDSGTAAATSAGSTATSATGAVVDDACALVTIDEVAAVTQVEVTPDPQPSSPSSCAYDSPDSGIFYVIDLQALPKADQDAFDTVVQGQERSATITPVDGVGDGKAALVEHDVNHTLYARKGSTLVSITVFNAVNDPTAAATELMKTALDRV
jgi:hypothetical protein